MMHGNDEQVKLEKMVILMDVLKTVEESIELFYEYENISDQQQIEENKQFFTCIRDALIRRFRHSVDLFLKVMATYLIEVEKMAVTVQSPRGIIREAVKVGVFSEEEGDECMDMVESRNKTSHTYNAITADEIAHAIPPYYDLMKEMIERMQKSIK